MATVTNPVLQMFRAALDAMYGERIERVVLYGSQARGDAQPDSDYDVAVFLNGLNGPSDRWVEADKIAVVGLRDRAIIALMTLRGRVRSCALPSKITFRRKNAR